MLLAAATQGPAGLAGVESSHYTRFNLLAWLHRTLPADPRITAAFAALQEAHPEYQPREHPDLNMYVTSGFVEDAEPFSPDELHRHNRGRSSLSTLATPRASPRPTSSVSTGPNLDRCARGFEGLCDSVPVGRYPRRRAPSRGGRRLPTRLIRGWSAAQLPNGPAAGLPDQVSPSSARGTSTPSGAKRPPCWLAVGKPITRLVWHDLASARHLARRLWPDEEVTGNVVSGNDAFLEAINHPAGDLAEFWTKVTAAEWARQGDMWAGLPPLNRR